MLMHHTWRHIPTLKTIKLFNLPASQILAALSTVTTTFGRGKKEKLMFSKDNKLLKGGYLHFQTCMFVYLCVVGVHGSGKAPSLSLWPF